ncbi:MAG: hypothetical protein LUF02_05630 [Erysipelotrichaceae bacterium]|nr:hypothetical protein [Erysipelotrichaceae bacterium]
MNNKISNSFDDKSKHYSEKEPKDFDDDFVITSTEAKSKKGKRGFLGLNFGKKK